MFSLYLYNAICVHHLTEKKNYIFYYKNKFIITEAEWAINEKLIQFRVTRDNNNKTLCTFFFFFFLLSIHVVFTMQWSSL